MIVVALEGVNGSGKSTFWRKMKAYFERFSHIGGPRVGAELFKLPTRACQSDEDYLNDHIAFKESLGRVKKRAVILDRSILSLFVYQRSLVYTETILNKLLVPEIVLYFDVPSEVAMERIRQRDDGGRGGITKEDIEHHQELYKRILPPLENPDEFPTIHKVREDREYIGFIQSIYAVMQETDNFTIILHYDHFYENEIKRRVRLSGSPIR